MTTIEEHTRHAVRLATENVAAGQFPFAALIIADGGAGEVIGIGLNTCRRDADPAAHGEVEAIRDACRRLGTLELAGAIVVSSCHPCPICQAVAGACGIARIYYAATRAQAAAGGFGMPTPDGVAEQIDGLLVPIDLVEVDGAEPFQAWLASGHGFETVARPVHELRVAVTAQDHEAAVRFYGYALGMPRLADWTSPDGKVVVFDGGRATLELVDEAQTDYIDGVEVGRRVAGAVRLALNVDDSVAMAERLAGAGATILGDGPVVTPWNDRNVRLAAPGDLQLTLFSPLVDHPR